MLKRPFTTSKNLATALITTLATLVICAPSLAEEDEEDSELSSPGSTIYKTVDKDGKVSYGRHPQKQSTEIQLENINTVPKVSIKERPSSKPSLSFNGYQTLAINQPANGAVIANGLVPLNVGITIKPTLQKGHRLWLIIDGQRYRSSQQTSIKVDSLSRGQHGLQVIVIDASDNTLKRSASSSIQVLRPGSN